MKKKILLAATVALLMSCHPTELLQSGPTKNYTNQSIDKIAVIAFPGELQDIKSFENKVAGRLGKKAIPAHKALSGQQDLPGDAAGLKQVLRSLGYQYIVEAKLVSIREETTRSSDDLTRREYRIMDNANYSKMIQEYEKREEKGATFQDTKVKMDIRLVKLEEGGGQVLWSARTETSNPKTAQKVASGMSSKAIPKLKRDVDLH